VCKIVHKAAKIGMYVEAAKMAWWLWKAACYESNTDPDPADIECASNCGDVP